MTASQSPSAPAAVDLLAGQRLHHPVAGHDGEGVQPGPRGQPDRELGLRAQPEPRLEAADRSGDLGRAHQRADVDPAAGAQGLQVGAAGHHRHLAGRVVQGDRRVARPRARSRAATGRRPGGTPRASDGPASGTRRRRPAASTSPALRQSVPGAHRHHARPAVVQHRRLRPPSSPTSSSSQRCSVWPWRISSVADAAACGRLERRDDGDQGPARPLERAAAAGRAATARHRPRGRTARSRAGRAPGRRRAGRGRSGRARAAAYVGGSVGRARRHRHRGVVGRPRPGSGRAGPGRRSSSVRRRPARRRRRGWNSGPNGLSQLLLVGEVVEDLHDVAAHPGLLDPAGQVAERHERRWAEPGRHADGDGSAAPRPAGPGRPRRRRPRSTPGRRCPSGAGPGRASAAAVGARSRQRRVRDRLARRRGVGVATTGHSRARPRLGSARGQPSAARSPSRRGSAPGHPRRWCGQLSGESRCQNWTQSTYMCCGSRFSPPRLGSS